MFGIGVPRSGTPWNKDWAPGGSKQTGGNRPPLGGGSPPMSGGMRGASVLPGFAPGARQPYMGTRSFSGGSGSNGLGGPGNSVLNNNFARNVPTFQPAPTLDIGTSARPPGSTFSPAPRMQPQGFGPTPMPPQASPPSDMSGPFTPGGFPAFPGGQPPPQSSGMPIVPGSVPGYDPNAGAARRNLINSILGASRPPPQGIST